jgi:outer membrane protein insertion porin family
MRKGSPYLSQIGIFGYLVLSLLLGDIAPVCAQESGSYHVSDVIIAGNRRIDTNAIKTQLHATSGTFTGLQVAEDVKTLYNTGFFDQVTVSVVTSVSGARTLKYEVVEKPVARKVFIKGNDEVGESDLAEILKFESRRFVDKAKIQSMIRKAISYYQAQGFYDATMDYATTSVGENEVDITFTAQEGERYRVRDVIVQGVKEMDESDVLSKLQIQPYKWWSSWLFGTGRVNQEMTEGDKQIIRQFLLDNGFLEGTVGEASIDKREDGLYVSFDVAEGDQYSIGKITATGDLVGKSAEYTLEDIKSEPGGTFSATQVRNDIFTITDKFSDEGYAYANVVPNTSINKKEKTVDLDFASTKGNIVKINKISVSGNEKTYDNVIRRTLKIEEQQLYSGTKIKRSQTLLQRLGYFDEVSITNQPTGDPSVVDLDVHVKEATTGSFSAGAGYSTNNGAIFNTKVSENNLFGTGRRVNLNVDVGSQVSSQVLSLDDPRINDSSFSGGIDLMRTYRVFDDFNRQLSGGAVSVGYPGDKILGDWAEDLILNTKYELENVDIQGVDENAAQLVKDSQGQSTNSSLTPGITRNTINNPLNPTRGSKQTVGVEYGGVGGDQEFYLLEARNSWFYPAFESSYGDIVFSDRTSFGYGESRNDNPFPLFRRFFPGGINSVRGYRNRTLGPVDINGNEYGGSKQLVNNLEMIFPLINSAGFKGVVFYDFGQAYDDTQTINLADLRQAWGYGIRWASPLGPIRVEFGYPIERQPGEDAMQTMFSFGAPL